MEIGGNAKAKEYFEAHGLDNTLAIADKYNSTIAEDYREKLLAEALNEPWTRRDRPVHIPRTAERAESSTAYQQFQKQEQEPGFNTLASEALSTLSWGWGVVSQAFTQTVADTTENYIRPGVQQLAESDVGANARRAVEQFGRRAREASAYSAEQFNKYAMEALGNERSEYAHLFDNWNSRANADAGAAAAGTDSGAPMAAESNVGASFHDDSASEKKETADLHTPSLD